MEVKGDYLRRANLLMRPQDAAGHHPAAPAQVGHASHATMQGWDGWWDSVGHAPGQHSVGHAQVGSHPGEPAQVGHGIWWDNVGHVPGHDAVGHTAGQVESLLI